MKTATETPKIKLTTPETCDALLVAKKGPLVVACGMSEKLKVVDLAAILLTLDDVGPAKADTGPCTRATETEVLSSAVAVMNCTCGMVTAVERYVIVEDCAMPLLSEQGMV